MHRDALTLGQPTRAAQYVRMSTDRQQYSIDNQIEVIARYAERHDMEIVSTYSDAGKSGVTAARRKGILELIQDVMSGCAPYSAILVYDVSRWGRFQDGDESAYYEYICKKANVQVHYCAEQFENDGTLGASLLKTIKRTMAAEYSRELGAKVFAGKCKVFELGFHAGGPPGYGLRRQLLDRDGNPKGLLRRGEYKSIQSDRMVLVPGPENEIAIIREIYRQYIDELKQERAIARWLNEQGIPAENGRPWSSEVVRTILTSSKYIGHSVFNRTSHRLQQKKTRNPPDMWMVRPDTFAPIVSKEQFARAADIRENRDRFKKDKILEDLRSILKCRGRLSYSLIQQTGRNHPKTLRKHFGSVVQVYQLLGYEPGRNSPFAERQLMIRQFQSREYASLIGRLRENRVTVTQNPGNSMVTISNELTAGLVILSWDQKSRWPARISNQGRSTADVRIAVRLARGNRQVLDYYVIPDAERSITSHLNLRKRSSSPYRFESVDFFISMVRRVALKDVV